LADCDQVITRTSVEQVVNGVRDHLANNHRANVNVLSAAPVLATNLKYNTGEVPDPGDPSSSRWKCIPCGETFASEANARQHCRKSLGCARVQKDYAAANPVWCNAKNKHPLTTSQALARNEQDAEIVRAINAAGLDFPAADSHDGPLMLDGKEIKNVKKFKYLGRVITQDNRDESAIASRLQAARTVYYTLHRRFLKYKHVAAQTKYNVWKSIVASQLTYAAETCVLTSRTKRQLDAAHRSMLRQITGLQTYKNAAGEIRYPRSDRLYRLANANRITSDIELQQLRFYGHLLRRPENTDLNFLLNAEISELPPRKMGGKPQLASSLAGLARQAGLERHDASSRSLWKRKCMFYFKTQRGLDQNNNNNINNGLENAMAEDSDGDI
jgi:hypothetical protein